MTFRRKLFFFAVLTSGSGLLIATAGTLLSRWRELHERTLSQATVQTDIIAANLAAALSFDDSKSAGETLAAFRADPNAVAAFVCKSDESLFAVYPASASTPGSSRCGAPSEHLDDGNCLVLTRPVTIDGQAIGTVTVHYGLDTFYAQMYWEILTSILVLGAALLAALLIAAPVRSALLRPVSDLAGAARNIAQTGSYDTRVVKHADDELGYLADAFNLMVGQIQNRDSELRMARDELEQRVHERTAELQSSERLLKEVNAQLNTLQRALLGCIAQKPLAALLDDLLSDLLRLTEGEYGFIAQVLHGPDGIPYLKAHAITNIAWSGPTNALLERAKDSGMEFHNLKSLFGAVITGRRYVIANDPANDPRRYGTPPGHPPLKHFLGLPIMHGETVVGMVGLANRPGGYDEGTVEFLEPVLITCANIIEVHDNELRRQKAERDLWEQSETLKRNVQALERANEAAEAANRSKSEFLANMSHEIRTPMTAILGFTEQLAAGSLPPDERDNAVETIHRNGKHLLSIINDVLDISKMDAGKLEIHRAPCDITALMGEIGSLLRVRATQKGLSLELEYDGPIPEAIETDELRLRQILLNLVGNAIKFTEAGGVRIQARVVHDDRSGPAIQFSIIDTGIGIPPDVLPLLFQPFSQADASLTRRFGGTGLGLSISKRFAEMLGGGIAVESTLGQGSVFRVSVACGSLIGVRMLSHPAEAMKKAPGEQPACDEVQPTDRRPLECRVLLAEDGPDNQLLISRILRKAGADVHVVENGELAVKAALQALTASKPFDVILMDMQMPVMDGYAATRRLRESGYQRPIIALTAHALAGDREKCIAAGCNDYSSKPINRAALLAAVQKHIGNRELIANG